LHTKDRPLCGTPPRNRWLSRESSAEDDPGGFGKHDDVLAEVMMNEL
jgi:hypothetical protein